jgi:hypothetical protein
MPVHGAFLQFQFLGLREGSKAFWLQATPKISLGVLIVPHIRFATTIGARSGDLECPGREHAEGTPRHRIDRSYGRDSAEPCPIRRPQPAVGNPRRGYVMASSRRIRRRSCCKMSRPYRSRNEIVGTGPWRRCRLHGCVETSSSPATVGVSFVPCTWPHWSSRYRCRA